MHRYDCCYEGTREPAQVLTVCSLLFITSHLATNSTIPLIPSVWHWARVKNTCRTHTSHSPNWARNMTVTVNPVIFDPEMAIGAKIKQANNYSKSAGFCLTIISKSRKTTGHNSTVLIRPGQADWLARIVYTYITPPLYLQSTDEARWSRHARSQPTLSWFWRWLWNTCWRYCQNFVRECSMFEISAIHQK